MSPRVLGIMTSKFTNYTPFPEKAFFTFLARLGKQENIQVIVFFPDDVSLSKRTIEGFHYVGNKWEKGKFPFPDLIYDRVFYTPKYYQKNKHVVHTLRNNKDITFLNHGFPGKWYVYKILEQVEESRMYLPPQQRYEGITQLKEWLALHKNIILKPIMGSHGKGVIQVEKGNSLTIKGRDFRNQYFEKSFTSYEAANQFLTAFMGKKNYLLQKYLTLLTPNGDPFDIRIFAQKDANGQWRVAGKGVRVGPKGKLTSNLYGGGKAYSLENFLKDQTPAYRGHIEKTLNHIGTLIPPLIEKQFGPLFELGIDVGIDQQGNPWILEVNSKPGRDIFKLMGDEDRKIIVHAAPIRYARYLLENK